MYYFYSFVIDLYNQLFLPSILLSVKSNIISSLLDILAPQIKEFINSRAQLC